LGRKKGKKSTDRIYVIFPPGVKTAKKKKQTYAHAKVPLKKKKSQVETWALGGKKGRTGGDTARGRRGRGGQLVLGIEGKEKALDFFIIKKKKKKKKKKKGKEGEL